IGNYGWRLAFALLSGIWMAIVLPVLLLAFRGAHEGGREEHAAVSQLELPQGSVSQGLRSGDFCKLLTASCLFAFTEIGIIVHFIPILTDRGAPPLSAASTASLVGVFSVFGRFGTGFLLDRFPAHIIGAGSLLLPIIGCSLLLFGGGQLL